jgi:SNF2 family DNA or RNA helicase
MRAAESGNIPQNFGFASRPGISSFDRMLRLFLPPNLAAAASRDAIAVKVEIDLTQPPTAELLPALALLQSWCRSPTPPPFVQLTRAQLRQLVAALSGKPVFAWVNQPAAPLLWIGPMLRGVSEHLNEPKPDNAGTAQTSTSTKPGTRVEPTAPLPARASVRDSGPRHSSGSLIVDGSEHFLAVTLPSREHSGYNSALDLLKTSGFVLEPSNRKWWLRDRHKVLNFLATHRERLRDEFHAEFTDNFEKNTAKLQEAEVVCDAVDNGNGFNVTVALRAGRVPEDQILSAAASNRGYVEDNGRVYLLDPKKIQKLAQAQRALAGDMAGAGMTTRRTHRISAARLAEAEEVLEDLAPHFQPPAEWKARSAALRDLSKLQPAPIPEAFDRLLRPYQRIGVAWLWHLFRHQLGGILADEMGLGKTLQALALLCAVKGSSAGSENVSAGESTPQPAVRTDRRKTAAVTPSAAANNPPTLIPSVKRRPSLVVCPASLVENWRREAARFAPQLRVFIHHGDRRIVRASDADEYDLLVTSYGTVARDRDLFSEVDFACLIADEAQHLKNRRTQNAQTLRMLRAKGRFLLTGTPVENSLEDLRSLFEVLMPGFLEKVPTGTRGDERTWFDERLRAKTAPYILRRTKQAVAPELPPKIEQVIYCELTSAQAAMYRRVQEESERALLDLEARGASENSIRLATLTQLLRLRQVCCDPRLVTKQQPDGADAERGTEPPPEYSDSAKLDTFRELLAEAVDDGHRLLVFSQFTSLLGLLRQELERQQMEFCYLDGSMSARARQAEVDRFNGSTEIPVFLISLKAGGTGLNLTAADTVVHFDPWWNPAVEAQATDRAHRIGQTRVVTSYKLICAGTVEEKVLQLQETKRALLADVFDASDAAAAKISLADLKALLAS